MRTTRIGSRESRLAVIQAELVMEANPHTVPGVRSSWLP